jgi:Ca2+-binding EF-hand superfamily protein
MTKNKTQELSADQLNGLPISIGEARKLLQSAGSKMSDEDVARKIMQMSEFGRIVLRALDLHK